jgi:hypothetical protein
MRFGAAAEADGIAEALLEVMVGAVQKQATIRDLFGFNERERTTASAAAALASGWAKISEPLRAGLIDGHRELLSEAVIDAAPVADARASLHLACLIAELGDPSLARFLPRLVEVGGPEAAEGAGRAVCRLASTATGPGGGGPGDLSEFCTALVDLLVSGRGHDACCESAMTVLVLPALAYGGVRGTRPLVRWFDDRDGPGHAGLRAALKRHEGERSRHRAWVWLNRDSIGAAALARFSRSSIAEEHESVLTSSHLAENPCRLKRLRLASAKDRRGRAAAGLVPAPREIEGLSPEARRGLPRFLSALSDSGAELRAICARMLADPDAAARHAAVLRLSPADLGDFCFDQHAEVARSAVLRHLGDPACDPRRLLKLARMPHVGVRRLAIEELEACDPTDPDSERAVLAARRTLRAHPDRFLWELRARVMNAPAVERLRALVLARRLALTSSLELELLRILSETAAERDHQHLIATAAAMFGAVGSAPAGQALRACAGHALPRVRANAVEALVRRAARGVGDSGLQSLLIEAKADPDHRVRANAIRGLFGQPAEAVSALAELKVMLEDSRPLHRLAGLWAAERSLLSGPPGSSRLWGELPGVVAEVARTEPEPELRARAFNLGAKILAGMRAGWQLRAPSVDTEAVSA